MAKTLEFKPEEALARAYADRLILEAIAEIGAVVKLSDVADRLQGTGIGLAALRALLASNPEKFAYNERRWVPASRLAADGRPVAEAVWESAHRFGGPMPVDLVAHELSSLFGQSVEYYEEILPDVVNYDPRLLLCCNHRVALSSWVFVASDEDVDRALRLNRVSTEEFDAACSKLSKIDWRAPDAIRSALEKAAPISPRVLGAAAWASLNPQVTHAALLYDWRAFGAELLGTEGFVFGADGILYPETQTKTWVSAAIKLADKIAPTVEIEESAPIDVKLEDVKKMVAKIEKSEASITATQILEQMYEITPSVKTFPDDLANVMAALQSSPEVWWVGGDRFRKPNSAPDYVFSTPELFAYTPTEFRDEDNEFTDIELNDDGLSSTLRKLLSHPLAMDVNDEEATPAPRAMPEQLRLVLKPIHRELGTFPLAQIPQNWIDSEPNIQELMLVDPDGKELQAWVNLEARLIFGLIDWWLEQPVESGAVFSLTRTTKPNVLDFRWLDQADPVVFISTQRMEELRNLQATADEMSTLDILHQVMSHWPKGADFLTILWEVNVVRRSSRRLVASLLSSYHSFYQRSGSPVWHFDSKKVDQGFDKSKRKFVLKRP